MANFLANLVTRLNQQVEVVRPRPVSMFEPQMDLDLSAWVAVGQPTVETGEAVEQQGDRQARGPNPTLPEVPAAQEQPRQTQALIEPRTQLASAKIKTKPEISATSDPPAWLGYLEYQPAFQSDRPPQGLLHTSKFETVPQGNESLLVSERAANPEVGFPSRKGHATARWEEHPFKQDAMPSIRPNLREPAESRKAIHLDTQISAKIDPSLAEPVINVTIGSVEVIAMPPAGPAKPPKPSRPSPVMSLDEYLKSRDQERQL